MKITYNWIKQFTDLKNISPQKLAQDLSLFGHEVESIEKINNDHILKLEITPNRGDCLSVMGIAREISALYDRKLNIPEINILHDTNQKPNISIENKKDCLFFACRIIDNIKIQQSPKWIKNKLINCGFRPLNNIVDITNYIMIETGQPLHAFDYDKISNGIVNIRKSRNNESIVTLDGKNNILPKNTIVISDDKKIYDLMGIMGGYNSSIDANTKNILLQGSILNPTTIRQSSKKIAKTTDASYRFERGVDPKNCTYSLNRATKLIQNQFSKCKVSKITKLSSQKYTPHTIKIQFEKVNKLLGTNIKPNTIKSHLKRLGFKCNHNIITVPSFRHYDVTIWQDIAEEIARIHGYNNLQSNSIKKEPIVINKQYSTRESLKDYLVNLGFTEVYSHSFAPKKIIEILGYNLAKCTQVINPVSPENKFLRPSLIPSLLGAISKNPWSPNIDIFEIGKVFFNQQEYWQLMLATNTKKAKNIKKAMHQLKINTPLLTLDKNIANLLKIRKNIQYMTCNLKDVKYDQTAFILDTKTDKYRKISPFAPTIRDLSFIVDINTSTENIRQSILDSDKHIFLVELFDEFISEKLGKNKKNIAYHVWMQDFTQPTSGEKSDIITNKVIKNITNKYKAKLR